MATQTLLKHNVSIIGAGPVGLTAAHLLDKAGITYKVIERSNRMIQHPAAHLINLRSMEIMQEIEVDKQILEKTENKEYFRYYRYLRRIFDPKEQHYAVHDHFGPTIAQKYREINTQSFQNYVHLPQPYLGDILYQTFENPNENILFSRNVTSISNPKLNDTKQKYVELGVQNLETKEKELFQSDFLIACDGFHSFVRNQQGVQMVGNTKQQSFLNIYFHSTKLANQINEQDQNAMLHFIFNSDITACLVNHNKEQGMFVLQVPVYPPFSEILDRDMKWKKKQTYALEYVNSILTKEYHLQQSDIEIKNVGFWNVANMQIEKYFKDRIIFAGDSAHGFPPAGGFGMNTGIHEIHNLVQKLKMIFGTSIQQDSLRIQQVLNDFDLERQFYTSRVINETMKQYRKSFFIAKKLGLSRDNLLVAHNILDRFPLGSNEIKTKFWDKLMKVGTYHLELPKEKIISKQNLQYLQDQDNLIPMIYYQHDVNYRYGKGFLESNERKRQQYKVIGQLLPHFYINFNQEEQVISSRQIADYIETKKLQTSYNFKLSLQEKYNQCDSKAQYFMFCIYKNPEWQNKQDKITAYFQKNFDNYKPNDVYGFEIAQGSDNNNSIIGFLDFSNDTDITPDEIQKSDQTLNEKLNSLFITGNEMVIVRQDSHILTIINIDEDI